MGAQPAVALNQIDVWTQYHQPHFANDGNYGNGRSWVSAGVYGSWIKIGKRKALIIATIALTLIVEMAEDNETIKDVRVCLGSVAPTPIEVKEIRKKIVGKKFNELDFNQLGQIVENKISPIDDIRGTKEYRKDVAKEIMINALEEIDAARRSYK